MKDLKYLNELVCSHNQWMFYGDESLELLRKNEKDNFISIYTIILRSITKKHFSLAKLFFILNHNFLLILLNRNQIKKLVIMLLNLSVGYRHRNYFKYINVSKEIKYEMITQKKKFRTT